MVLTWIRLTLALVCLLQAGIGQSAVLDEWTEYTTDHFVLYSDRPTAQATKLLQDFERFREAALAVVNVTELPDNGRTQIYLFNNAADYKLIQPDPGIAGFYRDTLRGARMVVGAEASLQDVSLVLFHEYSHHLIRSGSRVHYPLWYDEGFADLLATAKIEKDHVVVGLKNSWREQTLLAKKALPVAELLNLPSDKTEQYWDRYYASAWLLVHYLQLSYIYKGDDFMVRLQTYILALHQGQDPVNALATHLHMSVSQLDEKLRDYANQSRWHGYKVQVPQYQGALSKRRLEENETAYLLGDLAYRTGQSESAMAILQYVDASKASVAPALSLRAVLESHKHNFQVAKHIMSLALQMDASHPVVKTNAAHFYWDCLELHNQEQSDAEKYKLITGVMDSARAALKVDPHDLEASHYLAKGYQHNGALKNAIAVLDSLYKRRPTDLLLNFELGKLLIESGRPNQARPHLKNILAWDHSLSRRQQASEWLQQHAPDAPFMVSELGSNLSDN